MGADVPADAAVAPATTAVAPATGSKVASVLESPLLPKAAMVASAYHGLRRNHGSLVWGLVWGVAGHLLPLLVPALAVAQGFAKPRRCGGD